MLGLNDRTQADGCFIVFIYGIVKFEWLGGFFKFVCVICYFMRVFVFLQGTVFMHRGGIGVGREERVKQVICGEDSVSDFTDYVPIGKAVDKLRDWYCNGVVLYYCSSHRDLELVKGDQNILDRYGFPIGRLLFRDSKEVESIRNRYLL